MPTARRIRTADIFSVPWALREDVLARIARETSALAKGGVKLVSAASQIIDGPALVAMDGPHEGAARVGSVSIVPVYGVIENHSDWMSELFGCTTVEGLRQALAAEINDPAVKAIVLEIDSPGGTVAGITELCAEIRAVRGGAKPIVAVANTCAASAAYWLASQADEVVASPSANVGSVGVYAVHEDDSAMLEMIGVKITLISAGPYKTEGNEFEPLTDAARTDIQGRVDANYGQFLADVAAGRRIPVSDVEANYGGGRLLTAKDARAAGMVDRVETLAQTVARLNRAVGNRASGSMRGAANGWLTLEGSATGAAIASDDGSWDGDVGPEVAPLPGQTPFTERVVALAVEAAELVDHATERARLRAKEGRPAFSTTTERSLRTIREAIDELLEPAEPAASVAPPVEPATPGPVEPAPASTPPPAAPIPARFRSRDDWLRYLESHQ